MTRDYDRDALFDVARAYDEDPYPLLERDEVDGWPQPADNAPEGEPEPPAEDPERVERLLKRMHDYAARDWPAEMKIQRMRTLLDGELDSRVDNGRLVAWEALFDEEDEGYDFIIPGLIERTDRAIIVAEEGVGKTTLSRQIALCAAAGISPFTLMRMDPITTLAVDLENPPRIIRRAGRKIQEALKDQLGDNYDLSRAHLYAKPDGINLMRAGDRALLERQIEATEPDMIVLGPIYKSFIDPGGRSTESVAVEMVTYFDYLRVTYNCALWIEAHAPLGSAGSRDLRPFGSAVWSRWPEFGFTLTENEDEPGTYKVGRFRGHREQRAFPTKFRKGRGGLPFIPVDFATV